MKLKTSYLVIFQGLAFLMFLVITAWFNRFSSDDFYFIGELHKKSFQEVYHHLYFNWHGRWTSNLSELISFKFYNIPYILFIFNLISFFLVYSGIYQLFAAINNYYNLHLSVKKERIYSLVFLGVLFFCSFTPSSTWFWHTSTVVYLWGIAFFLWFLSKLVSKPSKVIDYIVLITSGIYFGGAYEPLAIICLMLLLYIYYKNRKNKKALIGFLFILAALLIDYFSSGTKFRDEITPSLGIIDFVLYTVYGTLKLLLVNSYKTILPALLFSVPFYFLGTKVSSFSYSFQPKKEALLSIVVILSVATINQAIVIYALGGLAPDRSTLITSFAISFFMIRYLFLLGLHHKNKPINVNNILITNCFLLVVFVASTSFYHYKYAKAYDDRMNTIKGSTDTIIKVKPLPTSGYIYSAEISTDSNYFSNQHLKSGLGIKNQIILDTE